jgi:hypothetical protein
MSLTAIVALGWFITTGLAGLAILRRAERRRRTIDWGSSRQLFWFALAGLIVLAATYVMLAGVAQGRLAKPGKTHPSQYFHLADQPLAFWLLLSVEFVLTAATAAFLASCALLVLRQSRHGA